MTFAASSNYYAAMTYDQLVSYYGSGAAAAAAIDTDRQRVHGWKVSGSIPIEVQIEYEVESKGALRADLPKSVRFPQAAA